MNPSLVLQPPGSNLCGRACVAMAAGLTLGAVLLMARMPRGLTRAGHLRSALDRSGISMGDRIAGTPESGMVSVCRVRWPCGKRSHWVLAVEGGDIMDPLYGRNPAWPRGSRIVSHYTLSPKGNVMNELLTAIATLVIAKLSDKETQDEVLDFFEDLIARSETKIDDNTIQPLINAYRAAAGVPDNDPPPAAE